MKRKTQSNSFAARLTAAQREELFDAFHAGLPYAAAGGKIHDWIKANDEAGLNGDQAGREIPAPKISTLSRWYRNILAGRQYHDWVKEAATTARAQGLKVAEVMAIERIALVREKLELEREKLAYERSRDSALEEARVLAERARAGEKGIGLQRQIDLVLEEIERMRRGEPV